MCGVIGAFYAEKQSNQLIRRQLSAGLEKISHRGPDAQNMWFSEDDRAALGHSRLSIVDLQHGQQPFVSSEGDIVAVVNGEFYNYKSIRESLIAEGYKFKTESDCEIIIPLYQKYGMALFDHLIGEFAFVIYDHKKKRVIAARDRFGIKPLFYQRNSRGTFFASESKALFELGIDAKWNLDKVFQDDFFIPNASQTYFKDIFAVKPAHFIIIENSSFHEKPYWEFDFSPSGIVKNDLDYIEELKSLMSTCVETRLHGDVPVGCYVSGGIDSSAILGLASKLYDKPITSYSIKFSDRNYDESQLAKEVAGYNKVEYVEVVANEQRISDNYSKAIWHNEGLIYNAQGVAKFLLSQRVRASGGKVVLTGEGADEIFAGYPFFREDMTKDNSTLRENNKLISGAFLSEGNYDEHFVNVTKLLGDTPSMWKVGAKFGTQFTSLYTESMLTHTDHRNIYEEALDSFELFRLRGYDKLNTSQYLWSKTKLPEVILSFLGDRMEMANSIEGRLPFLDHRMVEFAQKLPAHLKINNMVEKYVLREAAKDIIPESIYNRQKFPFTAPPIINAKEQGRSRLQEQLMDLLHGDFESHVPFYSKKKILQWIDTLPEKTLEQRSATDPIVNRILSSAVLAQHYNLSA